MKRKEQIPSIGELIKKKFEESGMTVTEFAKRIHTSRRNVYEIFSKNSLDTDMLYNISKVLGSDWLLDYFIKKFSVPKNNFSKSKNTDMDEAWLHKQKDDALHEQNETQHIVETLQSMSNYMVENKRTLNEIKALLHLLLERSEKK